MRSEELQPHALSRLFTMLIINVENEKGYSVECVRVRVQMTPGSRLPTPH